MEYVTVREASGRLGYHPSHIRRLCADGRLKAVKHACQWYVDRSCLAKSGSAVTRADPKSFPYVSTNELCKHLGMSRFSVLRRIRLGELEGAFKSPFKAWAIPRSFMATY